jgi:hypothetical protein
LDGHSDVSLAVEANTWQGLSMSLYNGHSDVSLTVEANTWQGLSIMMSLYDGHSDVSLTVTVEAISKVPHCGTDSESVGPDPGPWVKFRRLLAGHQARAATH